MARKWVFLILWFLTGCATEPPTNPDAEEPGINIVWPSPPEQARIRYLHSFSGPSDLDLRLPILKRVQGFIAGSENHKMVRPYAIAVNGQLIAVTDPGSASVHFFNLSQKTYKNISEAGSEALISPVGIALSEDRVYVADSALNKVFILDKRLKLVTTLNDFQRPTALAYDATNQYLYVADTHGHKILVYDREGKMVLGIGERGVQNGQFNFPSHLAVANGHLYVNDTMNFRVQVFDLDGKHKYTFGVHGDGPGYIAQPKGLAINSHGHVFLAEAVANRVQIFNLNGGFLLDFGMFSDQQASLRMPAGIVIIDDKIYVADSGNQRIQVFEYLGDE